MDLLLYLHHALTMMAMLVCLRLSDLDIFFYHLSLRNKNISDQEMLQTFNCGVGFCIILPKKNIIKIKKFFSKKFMPYEIGYISSNKKKINLSNFLKW